MTANEQLKQWREKNGFSQAYVARTLDISLGHYHRLERGKAAPSLTLAALLEGLIDIPASDWVNDAP